MPDRFGRTCADAAWTLIVQAAGRVQGKVFKMSPLTLTSILVGRGVFIRERRELEGRALYGVPVVIDRTLAFRDIRLEQR